MYLDKAKKEEIFNEYGKSTTDTGSAESQIALFTYRIKHLTEHVKANHKDNVTTRSLVSVVRCSTICTSVTLSAIVQSLRSLVYVSKFKFLIYNKSLQRMMCCRDFSF